MGILGAVMHFIFFLFFVGVSALKKNNPPEEALVIGKISVLHIYLG